ncbi:MAG: hypothetical protein M5U12_05245 [Verrucomicrobia bacterium]|nr:hypothetical protein [Verrucomicrobiota bacterium]
MRVGSRVVWRRRRGRGLTATLGVLGLVVVAAGVAAEERLENLAPKRLLPEGNGLAAGVSGDAGLRGHPDVIFADDFESGVLGAGWDETGNKGARSSVWRRRDCQAWGSAACGSKRIWAATRAGG